MSDLEDFGGTGSTGSPGMSEHSGSGVRKSITRSLSSRAKRLGMGRTRDDEDGLDATRPTTTLSPDSPEFSSPATVDHPHASVSTGHLGSVAINVVPASESAAKAEAAPKKKRSRTVHQTRKARLRVARVDPWSVMKTALLFGVAAWIIGVVAVWVVFTILDATGLYDAINSAVAQVFASPNSADTFNIKAYVNTTRATALMALIGAVDVILITALATVFAFLYNLSANVMGGIEVTLAED